MADPREIGARSPVVNIPVYIRWTSSFLSPENCRFHALLINAAFLSNTPIYVSYNCHFNLFRSISNILPYSGIPCCV